MFGFFASQEKKTHEHPANCLELADKVWLFRRDVLSEKESAELLQRTAELRQHVQQRLI